MAHLYNNDIQQLIQKLSLEEKVYLLSGADSWQTQEVGRLGIGSLKTTDGPSGARGHLSVDGPTAAFLPGPICQAATWSKKQLLSIGRLLCDEAKTKAAQILLAPTICLVRNPLGGRNFESFGEDPFLTGTLGIQYVAGVQESGEVVATPKHFVANEQEFERFSIDARISEKALREMYLKPFDMIIHSSSPPSCLMTSYNVVNTYHSDMNNHLIDQVLRREWGFNGLVMSDWGGTNSVVESVLAGCNLEMPGPPVRRGKLLLEACKSAENPQELIAAIDDSAGRVLVLCKQLGLLGLSEEEAKQTRNMPEQSSTSQEGIKLMRSVAAEGIVLLKNEQSILPLKPATLAGKQIAFIGPNAMIGTSGGGGSATMNPQYLSQPFQSFKDATRSQGLELSVVYSQGAYARKWLPLLKKDQWHAPNLETHTDDEKTLVRIDFFANTNLSGSIIETQYRDSSLIDLLDSAPKELQVDHVQPYSYRVTSMLKPSFTGKHMFSVTSVGYARVFVDRELILEDCDWTERSDSFYAFGSLEKIASKNMKAGQEYEITVEVWTKPGTGESEVEQYFAKHPSVRIGYQEELPDDMIDRAVKIADESDYSVVILGLDDEWESEGYDRQFMSLPGNQDKLAEALLSNCKHPERLIFINQSGSAVEFPWENKCSTLLQAWYGGQEAGNAIADVLLGTINPSGRLPVSWPRKYSDLPFEQDKETWPGIDGVVRYNEGCHIGYRYYLHQNIEPHFWFGYGLSYTKFETSDVELTEEDRETFSFKVVVQNVGTTAGQEVVQLYAWSSELELDRKLVSFEKTPILRSGENTSVSLSVRHRDLAVWDGDEDGQWVLKAGVYFVAATQHAGDKTTKATSFRVEANRIWKASEW